MHYTIPPTARASRFFSSTRLYSDIDWQTLDQIVDAFGRRIREWYVEPATALAANIHFAFSVMALNCMLIDTVSQFVEGQNSSSRTAFKEFIRTRLRKDYSQSLPTPIIHHEGNRTDTLKDVADVLYHGFRCGIVHQAHVLPYGGVVPHREPPVDFVSSGPVEYAVSGAPCPYVVVAPITLLADVSRALDNYLDSLHDRDAGYDPLRANFKRKFSNSFGIDITAVS